MKKIKKLIRFTMISIIVLVAVIYISRILFRFIWAFDIIDPKSYKIMYEYWEKGGVFNTFRDCSLGFGLLILPIIWLFLSYKLYKFGLFKLITLPISRLYRRLTRPKNMEIEHVSIKNMGGKDKSIDEIIKEKIEKQEGNQYQGNNIMDLRKQVAAKIEENEKE